MTVQVMNGMMEREDWEQALKTPIGMLPTGSGNALCASTLYEAGSVRSLGTVVCTVLNACIHSTYSFFSSPSPSPCPSPSPSLPLSISFPPLSHSLLSLCYMYTFFVV